MAQVGVKGVGLDIVDIQINASGFTPITTQHATNSVILQCRTAVDVLIYADNNDVSNYFTLKSGTVLTIDIAGANPDTRTDLWAKSNSGTPVLEVIGIY